MNLEEGRQYTWLLTERKPWTMHGIYQRELSYDRFLRKLYIPTRILRQRGTGIPIKMAHYRSSRLSTLRWISLFTARKSWKIANSFSPGQYR